MVDKTKQLLCGTDSKLIVYNVFENMTARTFIDRNARISMKGHRDIVRCLALGDHRAFSAGFDRRIVVYDINGAIDNKLVVLTVVRDAHGGIISCLSTARNADGQLLLISGSFDRLVKVWNEDGQLLNVIRGFNDTILSIAFIPTTETFWVASAENPTKIYDIQTANDVTDYCETFADWKSQLHHVVRLHYCPEVSMVIGITHRGYLVTWRSNPNSSLATLRTGSGIQAVALSPAQPQHFMTMGSDNRLLKWERRKSTRFSYVSEEIPINESLQECLRRTVQQKLRSFANIKADTWETLFPPSLLIRTGKRSDRSVGTPATNTRSKSPSSCSPSPSRSRSSSRYKRPEPKPQLIINPNRDQNFLRAIYIDSLEYLVAACEDGVVYILGYDFKATKQFIRTTSSITASDTNTPFKNEFTEDKLHEVCLTDINYLLNSPKLKSIMDSLRGRQLSDHEDRLDAEFKMDTPKSDNCVEETAVDSGTTPNDEVIKSVSRHVFGMKCHYALMAHKGSVTSLILFPESLHPDGIMTLVTSGWDKRICIWNLNKGCLIDTYYDPNPPPGQDHEQAAEGAILGMEFAGELKQFACCSADWSVYVRKASIHGAEMTLMNRLLGHHGEVGAILYRSKTTMESSSRENSINGQGEWISGSYDCTIRVWPDSSNGQCRMTLSTEGPVTCLAWERTHELLIAGVGKDVKIFDLEAGHLYQSYTGHLDIIRNIIILPEWNEYITASADGQIRVWRAWTGSRTVIDDSVGHTQSNAVNLFSNNPAASISAAVRTFLANESKKAKEISSVIG
ncbi:hypothetical protein FGIG_01747 [Fasciola gigantica]|uniref:Uncharacterized protein n=1 Tax=Fasciola gigantica TaxID=46835 RepID=A0A504YDA1_FASGI|nr:hypothetical protein FGIG_01747 [Fasciola gigantica]